MSRQRRLDFQGATHLVRVRGRPGDGIFFNAHILGPTPVVAPGAISDLLYFENMTRDVFEECGGRVHAYGFEPDRASWVLQIMGAPLEAIMRRVCREYSHYLHEHRRIPGGRPVFCARYESKLISPTYLLHAVRRIHRGPMNAGLTLHYASYPFSSDRVYCGQASIVPLVTTEVWKSLSRRGYLGVRGYRKFMDQVETPYVARLFARGSPQDARIVGDRLYAAKATSWAAQPRVVPGRDQLLAAVAGLMGNEPAEILSRTHSGVVGRALVAWYATRTGAASLTEVGRWFALSGAALHAAIRRYRSDEAWSSLFNQAPESLFDRRLPAMDE